MAAVALLLFCEWSTDETGFIFAVLLALAGSIGFFMLRFGWLGGAIIGASIPIAHSVSLCSDRLAPAYQKHPPKAEDC